MFAQGLRLGSEEKGVESIETLHHGQLTRETEQFKLKLDMPKKKKQEAAVYSFSQFLSDPTISAALVVFGLITLLLSIIEFGGALY